MAIFTLTHAGITLTLRARCITCARNHAADNAGPEGPRVWRDNSMSTLTVLYGSTGHNPEGRTEILNRTE